MKKEDSLENQQSFQSLFNDASHIVEEAKETAVRAVNVALTIRNWKLGERIARENLDGKGRAEYGKNIMFRLSDELTKTYGKGFDRSSLYKYMKFYQMFPQIVDSTSPQSYLLYSHRYGRLLH